ncbi:MAG: hypothetical protein FJX59_04375 [Alphaproteobacteria bacterium]|nr:hypothetical protein [Alphaproteobacteria bacterium]
MLFLAILFAAAAPALAEVTRIEILERVPLLEGRAFGKVGAYERIRGRLTFAANPNAPENGAIVDLKLAPRDAEGRVTYAADFLLLKPVDPARANGRLLYEVNNRGNIGLLGSFNNAAPSNAPSRPEHAGTGFLFEQGYIILSTGWSWDVAPGGDRIRADLPGLSDAGKPITGRVTGEVAVLAPTDSASHVGMLAVGYPPVDPAAPDATLTVRETANAPSTAIARERWRFGRKIDGTLIYDPAWITLDGGFEAGAIYRLVYRAREPRVVGLGLAAIRDALSFFRYEKADRYGAPNPLLEPAGAALTAVLAFGHSQSGRVLAAMLELGLTLDGRDRPVMDGIYVNVAGGGKGSFNFRFAQTSRHFSPDVEMDYPTDYFPFSTADSTDPETQVTTSLLARYAGKPTPKLFIVNSSAEYWARAASLVHTTADAGADLPPAPSARVYLMTGGQHNPGRGGDRGDFSACRNPLDYRPMMRGLLIRLDAWVTLGREPPASAVPQLADGTLGTLAAYTESFPKIPALRVPGHLLVPPRLDFGPRFASEGIADLMPPQPKASFATRIPQPDTDGIDRGGLRMPEITAPLGTYTGWNLYNAATEAPDRIGRWDGSFIPFPRSEDEKIATADPRRAVSERYASKDAYLEAYAAATLSLAEQELILDADVNPMIDRAGRLYDRVMARGLGDESCDVVKENR